MQLTTKDLLYLSDELSWELLAMKKCYHFAQEAQDLEIRNMLNQIGRQHQKHYELLLAQLQTAAQQSQHDQQSQQNQNSN